MSAAAYPLYWPQGIPRTKADSREASKFKTGLDDALKNVERSLRLFGQDSGRWVSDVIISSNVSLGHRSPPDPGIAVWFTWDKRQVCIPVDRYATPAANLQAIHHVLEARRVEARHGTLTMVQQSFAGFAALPPPRHWTEVLGVGPDAGRDQVEAAFKAKARVVHSDHGGADTAMADLNLAREAALARFGR